MGVRVRTGQELDVGRLCAILAVNWWIVISTLEALTVFFSLKLSSVTLQARAALEFKSYQRGRITAATVPR